MGEWSWVIKAFVLYLASMFVLRVAAKGLMFARHQLEWEWAEAAREKEELRQKAEALRTASKEEVIVAERADGVMALDDVGSDG